MTEPLPASLEYEVDPETALLLTARNRIRQFLHYSQDECEIEYDEIAKSGAVGNVYVVVSPDGVGPGEAHLPGGTTVHEVYGFRVTVIVRSADIPRDARRAVMLGEPKYFRTAVSLNRRLTQIRDFIDFSYDLINEATQLLRDAGDTRQGFLHPFAWIGQDPTPRIATPELFGSGSGPNKSQTNLRTENVGGLVRTVRFGRCERYTVRQNFTTV